MARKSTWRRWLLRLSVRSLLILGLALSLFFAWIGQAWNTHYQEQTYIQNLRSLHESLQVEYCEPQNDWVTPNPGLVLT